MAWCACLCISVSESKQERIHAVIRALPHGSVCSYGAVAAKAGFPGRARLVARILSESEDAVLPWHRVLRASGRIAFPEGSPMYIEQTQRLRQMRFVNHFAVKLHRARATGLSECIDDALA